MQREVTWNPPHASTLESKHKTRFDFKLTNTEGLEAYVEVKSVTYSPKAHLAAFPDAVSVRAHKHLQALMQVQQSGKQAYLIFCVQRTDAHHVTAAKEIDPIYAELLQQAQKVGVSIHAFLCKMDTEEIKVSHEIPIIWS